MAELSIVPDPCSPARDRGRVEAEGRDPFCLSEMLQMRSHLNFQMQVFYYVQTHAVRKGDAPEEKVSCLVVPSCIV